MTHWHLACAAGLAFAVVADIAEVAAAADTGSAGAAPGPDAFSNCVVVGPVSNIVAVFPNPAALAWPPKVLGPGQTRTFPVDEPIPFAFSSVVTNYHEVLLLRPEYGYKLTAVSSTGQTVTPTRLGAHYGSDFDHVRSASKERALDTSGGRGRPFLVLAPSRVLSSVRKLPSPERLFRFEKPGTYVLSIQVQCFTRAFPPKSTNVHLVRFPPAHLRVIKAAD